PSEMYLNGSPQNTTTSIRLADEDNNGSIAAVIAEWDAVDSEPKGFIRLMRSANVTVALNDFLLFTIDSITPGSGYYDIAVTPVGSSGADPLPLGESIYVLFTLNGDKGEQGE